MSNINFFTTITRCCSVPFILFLCFSIQSCVSYIGQLDPAISNVEIEKTREICRNLGLPPLSTFTKKTSISKSTLFLETIEFKSTNSIDGVEQYFHDNLNLKGWTVTRKASGGIHNLDFFNERYSVGLEFDTLVGGGSRYFLNCSWGLSK